MSLFRKPKKIQRRMFCADDDEDGEPEPPPPPVISERTENKPVSVKALLSFADEEDGDGEVFQVKKSSQSKRLSKRREKERRKGPDGDTNKFDNNGHEDNSPEQEPKLKPKKRVLEGLILSGREALAADGAGDISDGSGEDDRGFHRYRPESVRAALAGAPGCIPDAALIHAARKTRQQARELGEFIPLQSESAGSRLARDEDHDDDDDDDEEDGRIQVRGLELPSDKPMRGTTAESEEDADSEVERWEEQQLQKAMPTIIDITGEAPAEARPRAPAPRAAGAPPHLRPLHAPGAPAPACAADLREALRLRLEELQIDRSRTAARAEEVRSRLDAVTRKRDTCAERCTVLDATYRRAQAARGYITDLIECLDEKMGALEALEARALAAAARRGARLVERRRADVRDQAQDVLARPVRPGAAGAGGAGAPECEEKRRRAAEREGRRRARRLRREAAARAGPVAPHRDGDSSDDDLPPTDHQLFLQEIGAIRAEAAALFADALPAWRSARGVCARLARLRARAPPLYSDAHVAACLPRLLAPYVRHQLILWNPLADEDNEDYEKMDWYKCLMMYGVKPERLSSESEQSDEEQPAALSELGVREDPDLLLVPHIVDKVLLPKITELVEQAWDPMCVRACVRLRLLLVRAAELPVATCLPALATAVRARLAAALNADVFLPALPPQIMDGAGGAFWRRCLGGGVRLLRAAIALAAPPPVLHADPLVLTLIDRLCTAAGAAPGPAAAAAAAALADTLPRGGALRPRALRRLAALARLALDRLHAANPLHLKALEQARGVLAEARAVE